MKLFDAFNAADEVVVDGYVIEGHDNPSTTKDGKLVVYSVEREYGWSLDNLDIKLDINGKVRIPVLFYDKWRNPPGSEPKGDNVNITFRVTRPLTAADI